MSTPSKATKSVGSRHSTESMRQRRMVELAEKKAKKPVKGFQNNAQNIAKKQGVSYDRAAAILAAGTRKASPAAKKANPALKKVKAASKGGKK